MRRSKNTAYDRLLLAVWLACVAVQDVHTHRLDNGLTLHVAPGHPAPVVAVQAWVGVGSADEQPHEVGIAHAVEHMLFKGSTGYGLGELARTIESGGGEINAFTAFDHTVYHAVLGRDHDEAAIEAIGDTLLSPRVDPQELAREREVILEEIRQGSDDPARSVAQSLFATAFAQHPYRRPVIGTVDSVRELSERQLVEFFRSHYVADNLTLVVAGDVDPERIKRAVERRFHAMPSGLRRSSRGSEPAQTAPRASAQYREVSEAYLAVGFHVPPARHPDVAALDVAAILLGQSESARLPRLLRDRDRMVSSAYANVHALRDPGLIVLSATIADARRASAAVGGLVDHALALTELDSDELEIARIAAESSFVRQLETAQGRARSLGWHATVVGDPQFGHVYLDRIRSVRRHDVAKVMQRYLRPHNASVAAILPKPTRSSGRRSTPGTRATFAREAETRVRKALAPRPRAVQPLEKRVVLGNGTVLLVRRDPSVPVVAMRAVWKGGQRVEDPAHAGASTLLARMITRGCGTLDAAQLADRVDRLGGAISGISGRNSFGLAAEWLARSWKQGFELVADCVIAPTFPQAELAHQRRLLLDDQAARKHDPTQVAFRAFSEALYGDHPYARDVLGTPTSIRALEREVALAFYRERYPASSLTLSVVGDIDVDEVIAAARARFDKLPRTRATMAGTPAPFSTRLAALDRRPTEQREVYQFLERAQAHLVVGYPGATLDAPDRFALELLVAILGGQGGRLFAELRDKRALVYRVSAHSIEGVDPGFVAVYLSCAPDKVGEAVAVVRAELERIRVAGVTAAELDRAKSYAIGSHQIAMQRRAAIANAMAYHEAYGLGWESWSSYDDAIRAVTPAEIIAAATRYLRPERMITTTVRPPIATPGAQRRSRIAQPPRAPVPPKRRVRTPARVRPRGKS